MTDTRQTHTHYDVEDVPDVTVPETALDMWQSQVASMPELSQIDDEIAQAEQTLQRIYGYAEKRGLDKMQRDVTQIWQKVVGVRDAMVRSLATVDGARIAIDAIDSQRREALAELNQIVSALQDDGEHHLVSDFADMIVNEEMAELQDDSMYWAHEQVGEEFNAHAYGFLMQLGQGREWVEIHIDILSEIFRDGVYPSMASDTKAHLKAFLECAMRDGHAEDMAEAS